MNNLFKQIEKYVDTRFHNGLANYSISNLEKDLSIDLNEKLDYDLFNRLCLRLINPLTDQCTDQLTTLKL